MRLSGWPSALLVVLVVLVPTPLAGSIAGTPSASAAPVRTDAGLFNARPCLDRFEGVGAGCRRTLTYTARTDDDFDLAPGFRVVLRGRCATDELGLSTRRGAILRGPAGIQLFDARSQALCSFDRGGVAEWTGRIGQVFRSGQRTSTWRVTVGDQPVASGRLVITTRLLRPERTRRITEAQFDDFINLCVNGSERLFASGGQLYCTHTRPGVARTTIALLPVGAPTPGRAIDPRGR